MILQNYRKTQNNFLLFYVGEMSGNYSAANILW